MSAVDKKRDIIQMLESSNDEQLIEEVYELLHSNNVVETIDKNELPLELKSKIEQALEDYKNGHYITHEQMKQKMQEWLTT